MQVYLCQCCIVATVLPVSTFNDTDVFWSRQLVRTATCLIFSCRRLVNDSRCKHFTSVDNEYTPSTKSVNFNVMAAHFLNTWKIR